MIAGDTGARLFADWSRSLHTEKTEQELLERIILDATKMVPGAEMAGVSVTERRKIRNAAWTSDLVCRMDTLQSDGQEGPSLEATTMDGDAVRADDLSREPRWPSFSTRAAKLGVLSVLSLPLHTDEEQLGSLSLYACGPAAFDLDSESTAAPLAAHAALALSSRRVEANLREALESRDVIGQGVGILVERHKIAPDAAFEMLVSVSQHNNVKLRFVAAHLADTGELSWSTPQK
ncbi:GAF and ANTAR domain-containing protein [Nocardiopsis xinjiangensis]|uniref:GAF and ANTAR domain-containing protein n=1 Tax=Nocardiopsis xinjiangensis TaxID=124285 RepID=UPI00034DF05E|nr:GAF and ANTAR domain-containing protein [Nocardiopsis xinjiangensis]